jgi:carbamoyl-phosphate synthase large subunit
LDELKNDITEKTPASFEPALDYVVIKAPRFAFEKFQQTEPLLGTQMKSVGEVMAIGRTFKEAFQKAFNSMELGNIGLLLPKIWADTEVKVEIVRAPRFDRWWLLAELLRKERAGIDEIHEATGIDRWFLRELAEIIACERMIQKKGLAKIREEELRQAKTFGFSDKVIAALTKTKGEQVKKKRHSFDIHSSLNQVDTCAGEFEALTPYYYFAYENFVAPVPQTKITKTKPSVVILGSGPNRIGQGVEFDYCCVKAAQAIEEFGYETVMINCNPETVSTDYDTVDRLYFEPLDEEYVRRVLHEEGANLKGILCQTGGQTALRLSQVLDDKTILGTSAKEIDRAEDRAKFDKLLHKLKLRRPKSKSVNRLEDLPKAAESLGFPVLVRPSYVLGGRSMYILRTADQLQRIIKKMLTLSDIEFPLLIDRFLEDAIEIDVDCIGDGTEVVVVAVMEHIEEAGIHSGDSSCSLPAFTLSNETIEKIRQQSIRLGRELKLCGFLNIQFALMDGEVFVLEVNPRASRTLPFVCKATGVNWVRPAVYAMLGRSFKEQKLEAPSLRPADFSHFSVKNVVFPFIKFPGSDTLLGPEMKSTGEVMGVGSDFSEAFVKGLVASGHRLPREGQVFVSVRDSDKPKVLDICSKLKNMGFRIVATHGTAAFLKKNGIASAGINKVKEGQPHIVDAIINGEIVMVINTTDGEAAISDSFSIRRSALQTGVPHFTALTAARAAVNSLSKWIRGEVSVKHLKELEPVKRLKRMTVLRSPAKKKPTLRVSSTS